MCGSRVDWKKLQPRNQDDVQMCEKGWRQRKKREEEGTEDEEESGNDCQLKDAMLLRWLGWIKKSHIFQLSG